MIHFLKGIERRPYREAFFYGSRRGLYFGSGGRAWTYVMRSLLCVRYGGRLLLGVPSGIHLETQDHMPPGIV